MSGPSENAMHIRELSGRGLPLRGDDVDTDRIMPARFLRATSFEGLERHVFEDDRKTDPKHPFDDPRFGGASILVVNRNFGCGSSREHAPQGLARFGITAIVGESFSEIFQGNSAMLGIPCFVASPDDIARLQALVESKPLIELNASVVEQTVTGDGIRIGAALPPALRDAFLSGQWNPTATLLDRFDEVRAVANRLPYVRGF